MTKPEGPAQEPEACLCVCPRCMPRDQERTSGGLHCGEGKCSRAPVPATPTPSQPAARECDDEWPRSVEGVMQELAYLHGRAMESGASASMNLLPIPTAIYWLRELAQQTAAKDAELDGAHRVWCELIRERDSLREANARLAADLDAALKAGKDGQ